MLQLLERLRPVFYSLRFRLMLWNVAAVALTSLAILSAVRQGVRYTLVDDLDRTLVEDIQEIKLSFEQDGAEDWTRHRQELNLKAVTHQYHGWFVQFYNSAGEVVWSSTDAPTTTVPVPPSEEKGAFNLTNLRIVRRQLPLDASGANYVVVGCRIDFIERDISGIDRLVMLIGCIALLVSPLIGMVLTNRAVEPLAQMIRITARIQPGEVEARVPLRGTGDELDRLAATTNNLLDRIADYLAKEHDFLANAAHELRTPLSAIRSNVEVSLSSDRSENDYRELLGLVIEQCITLQTLVNQLLLLAEVEADRSPADLGPVALDRLVAQSVEMFQGVAELNDIAIRTNALHSVVVTGNGLHLRQVLNNLLDNAFKFTAAKYSSGSANAHRGEIIVLLTKHLDTSRAKLTVKDNGIGISSKDLPHVLDRFYRADKSRARDQISSGTGLGLSICKAIVESNGGEITVESVPDEGTTVTISLPLADVSVATRVN